MSETKMSPSKFKILVTGKNRKVMSDICEHIEADKGYTTLKCAASKKALELKAMIRRELERNVR